jgi:membrane protease YdiL (CAAX protease family)
MDLSTKGPLRSLWQRLPILIRAIVVGFLVFEIGVGTWLVIAALIPAPGSIVVMSGVLWIYWKYFSGSWWPKATAEIRRDRFRAIKMPAAVWKWSLVAALLLVVITQSSFVLTFRIIELPESFAAGFSLDAMPIWLAWLAIVMASLVAGICEEIGFRGYMQVPLERRYGPAAGITIVSISFIVFHLNQAWAPPVLVHLFAFSVLWGILAYASGSLIPSMISHIVADIFNFSYWWTDVAGTFDRRPVAETGIDAHLIVWVSILVASVALFSWAARKTLASRREESGEQDGKPVLGGVAHRRI